MLNHSGGMQMFNAEATGITHDKIRPRISSTAKQMWGIYTCLTVLLFLLLWAGPMDAFDAACHAMATMSTGGFSTSSSGINAWPGTYVKVILTVFMFLGGVNFALIYKAMHGQMHALRDNDTFRTYLRVIALSTAVFIVCIVVNGAFIEWSNVTIDPLFQVVSSITSTGYSLSAFNYWGVAVVALSFILMFSGGCAGSTSGGVKVDRLVCLMKFLHNEVKRLLRPNSGHGREGQQPHGACARGEQSGGVRVYLHSGDSAGRTAADGAQCADAHGVLLRVFLREQRRIRSRGDRRHLQSHTACRTVDPRRRHAHRPSGDIHRTCALHPLILASLTAAKTIISRCKSIKGLDAGQGK